MSKQTITVPDIGSEEPAEIVEVCVAPGDRVELEQSLIVIETEKASVEVPSTHAGKVLSVMVKEGDRVGEGAAIVELELEGDAEESSSAAKKIDQAQSQVAQSEQQKDEQQPTSEAETPVATAEENLEPLTLKVPELGDSGDVDIIEVCVAPGDEVNEGDSLIVLETEKASMEVPATQGGKILEVLVQEGQKTKEGADIVVLQPTAGSGVAKPAPAKSSASKPTAPASSQSTRSEPATPATPAPASAPTPSFEGKSDSSEVYAGPSVRKLARQLGVDLRLVKASGPRGRQTKDDVREYVKKVIAEKTSGGAAIPAVPAVDFAKFGAIKRVKMSKIKKSTAANMHRSWLNVPHVTQFDEADITDLESYRKDLKSEAEQRGVKITPVPFLLKACALTLREEKSFNVSLDPDGEHVIEKDYVHIGMAVDTPAGLMVPVIRDVDKKDIWEIAKDVGEAAQKAKDGKLLPKDMQGGCFTISSLGAIGGQGFTPIVNTPEVGILGVSKTAIKPQWDGKNFVPRTMLPLSLSYDHKAVNGADAGRFLTYLVSLLEDVNKLS